MPKQLQKFIETHSGEEQLQKSDVFQSSDQSQRLTYLKSGYIKRYLIKSDGTISTQSIYGPGYIFPLTHVYKLIFNINLSHSEETYYYEAITPAVVHMVDDEILIDELKTNPALYKDLFLVSGERLKSNIQRLEVNSLHSAYNQLAYELFCLGKMYGENSKAGIKILVPITHQDLADILDTSRETVSVNISKLKKLGIIKNDKNYIITDMEKLLSEAEL